MPKKIAAFFDIDNTLVHGSSSVYFLQELLRAGYINKRDIAFQLYHGIRFKLMGEDMDFLDRIKEEGLPLNKAVDVKWVQETLLDSYHKRLEPKLKQKTVRCLQEHQQQGHDVWLLSAAPQVAVDTLVNKLKLTGGYGTQEKIVEGQFTGELEGSLMHGQNKASKINSLVEKYGYDLAQCFAYSDSSNDIPMLKMVGHPTAVSPDNQLARYAHTVQWPVLD